MPYIVIIASIVFLFGICVGSFLNVCIYRIPNQENIVTKRSHCMACGNVLKWYELIPVFSYVIQGGKCRNCRTKLSCQYPAIELVNGVLWVWVYLVCGATLDTVVFCLLSSVLLVISVIDWKTFEIPLGCNICILFLGMVRITWNLAHWYNYVIGFFLVSGFFAFLYLVSKGKAMGGGDIKLMAVAGFLLGWKEILLAMVLGCVIGSASHLVLMKYYNKDRVLAFGPYLCIGIFFTMLYGNQMIDWYLRTILQ